MMTLSKPLLTTLILSAFALSQGTPSKTQTNSSRPATTSATSQNAKNQKAAAAKGATHTGNLIGNHKDIMETAAPAPAAGKTQPATTSTAPAAAQPTPAPGRPKK